MSNQTVSVKKYFQNFPQYTLILLSVGLTFISLQAGYYFYNTLFGITIAWTASSIFELLRLSTLYFIILQNGVRKILGWTLYFFIALMCSFAAICSFHAQIIENRKIDQIEIQKKLQPQIEKVIQLYIIRADSIKRITEDNIRYCERKLAANPASEYWANRLSQIRKKEDEIGSQLDSLLIDSNTAEPILWLSKHSARVGLSFTIDENNIPQSSISVSIQQIIGLSQVEAKKFVATIITCAVEFGILLLSFLSKIVRRENIIVENNDVWSELFRRFDQKTISRFRESHREYFNTHHVLPNNRNLSKVHREIKKTIKQENFSLDQLANFINNSRDK